MIWLEILRTERESTKGIYSSATKIHASMVKFVEKHTRAFLPLYICQKLKGTASKGNLNSTLAARALLVLLKVTFVLLRKCSNIFTCLRWVYN